MMIGQERFQDINRLLNNRLNQKKSLIAVHRGISAGNIVENTIPAYEAAFALGADMFEVDVISSTDGILYAFHDGTEKHNLHKEKNIKLMSSKEIDDSHYYNSIDHICRFTPERFCDIMKHFNNDELCNIDRAWDIFPKIIDEMKAYPYFFNQAVFKSPVKKDVLEFLNDCEKKVMYMPICSTMDDIKTVASYKNINFVGAEILAKNQSDELFGDAAIEWLHEHNLFAWANAITLDEEHILFAGLDDTISLLEGWDKGWIKLFEKKIDIIQTDWPYQLSKCREAFFD